MCLCVCTCAYIVSKSQVAQVDKVVVDCGPNFSAEVV